ncbi:MAG: hypothetical protein H6Q77_1890 [Gemmatimonadetes bacterium]|jgi:hypothetical protein|nr:hypothetical protein [Gemmatimonadota bacterium]
MTRTTLMCLAVLLAACGRDRATASFPAADASTPGNPQHVDSVVPRDVAIERFRQGTQPVSGFTGGASSRDALVKAWVKAIETADTAALTQMLISRDEFAWVYYPTASQGLPPYDLSPSLLWFMVDGQTSKGLRRLLEERAGKPMHVIGYACDPKPTTEGENHLWGPCELKQVRAAGDTIRERLFGLIVERGGQWKFLSYKGRYD